MLVPKTSELIAFVCGDNTDLYNHIFSNSLYTVRPDGSHLRDISIDESMIHYDLDWSPNGEWLALTLEYDNVASRMDEWNPVSFYHEIHRLRYDGAEARRLTYNDSAEKKLRWTRDSRDILYHDTWSGTWQLHRVGMVPTNPHALSTLEIADFDLSPDRLKIAATARERDGGSKSIYLLNPDGTALAYLTTPNISVAEIQWSPDKARILYYSYSGRLHVYNIVAGREEPTPLIRIRNAQWSPNSRWIAIVGGLDRNRKNDEWIDFNGSSDDEIKNSLHLYDIATGELTELVNALDGKLSSVSWSPDSQWLAFAQGSPNAQVHKIRGDGSGLQQLTDLDCNAYGLAWSPQ